MEAVGGRFVPHALAARTGQPIEFANMDRLPRNVHAFLSRTANSAWRRAARNHRAEALTGLPPGRYEISAWHEGLKSETREAAVEGVDVRLDFLLQRR